jgi:hypothetical protein
MTHYSPITNRSQIPLFAYVVKSTTLQLLVSDLSWTPVNRWYHKYDTLTETRNAYRIGLETSRELALGRPRNRLEENVWDLYLGNP